MNTLIEQVRHFLDRHPQTKQSGVVAVSGGPDSTVLAHALVSLQSEEAVGDLTFAHVNHLLRGAESDADEAAVAEFVAQRTSGGRVRFRSCRIDVAAHAAQERDNLESVGRRLRYAWFADVARETGATWVATGHTANDQAETVLQRLLRGTGLHGLTGIPAIRPLETGIVVLRPLLRVNRAAVLTYLGEHGLPNRQDSTNLSADFTRNRIRHDLLPKLVHEFNPAAIDLLCRLAEQASEAQVFVAEQADRLLREAELPRAGARIILQAAQLRSAPGHLVREMFRLLWKRENWPEAGMSYDDWKKLSEFSAGDAPALELPGKVRLVRRGRVLQVGRQTSEVS